MEKRKKFNIIKLIVIIATIILFIGLILPYQSAIGEHKEYLEKYPDAMNIKEVEITNKDAINISILKNLKVYNYTMNNIHNNSWISGEATINFVIIIVLIISIIFVLLFTLFNKRVLTIIFDIILLASTLLMNYDIVSRGVIPSDNYTYGISFWLYPILAILILILTIVLIVKNKKIKNN